MQSNGIIRFGAAGLAAGAALLLLPSLAAADHRDRDHRRGHGHYRKAPVHEHGPWCASRHGIGHGHGARHYGHGKAHRYAKPHRYAFPHFFRYKDPHKYWHRKHLRRHDRFRRFDYRDRDRDRDHRRRDRRHERRGRHDRH